MKTRLAALLALSLAACGGSSTPDAGSSTPVSHDPLSGKLNGASWTAGMATAMPDFTPDSGAYFVTVYAAGVDAGCSTIVAPSPPQLLSSVPWVANTSYDLGFPGSHNFTFSYVDANGQDQNDVATTGRIELDAAPVFPDGGPSPTTTLRMRGSFGSNSSVEGQVSVMVCPPF